MKSASLNIKDIKRQAIETAEKVLHYHLIISFIAVSGFLIYAVLTVNTILNGAADTAYREEQEAKIIKTKFDETAIKNINYLKSREENPQLRLRDGRLNPFSEQ